SCLHLQRLCILGESERWDDRQLRFLFCLEPVFSPTGKQQQELASGSDSAVGSAAASAAAPGSRESAATRLPSQSQLHLRVLCLNACLGPTQADIQLALRVPSSIFLSLLSCRVSPDPQDVVSHWEKQAEKHDQGVTLSAAAQASHCELAIM